MYINSWNFPLVSGHSCCCVFLFGMFFSKGEKAIRIAWVTPMLRSMDSFRDLP